MSSLVRLRPVRTIREFDETARRRIVCTACVRFFCVACARVLSGALSVAEVRFAQDTEDAASARGNPPYLCQGCQRHDSCALLGVSAGGLRLASTAPSKTNSGLVGDCGRRCRLDGGAQVTGGRDARSELLNRLLWYYRSCTCSTIHRRTIGKSFA